MKTIKRYQLSFVRERCEYPYNEKVTSDAAIAIIARGLIGNLAEEQFLLFVLDINNHIAGYVQIGKGSVDACPVDIRPIFSYALMLQASNIIVVHNHPSGNIEPSCEDNALTKRIAQAGKLLNITVLDHIIVSDLTEHYSYALNAPGFLK